MKGLVVAAAFVVGALSATGCLIGALFEVQGFGGPRDEGPRTGYVALLAVGFAASVGVPVFLCRWLFPRSGPGWLAAGAVIVGGCVVILGLSLRG